MRQFLTIILGQLILLASVASTGWAVTVERLVMPGEVIQGHVKYENECRHCHDPFNKSTQRRLCLNCHKKVAEDLNKGHGYHGLNTGIKTTECKHCHTEHKGRDKDVVGLDKDTFDHDYTDFKLKGAHIKVQCTRCHKNEVKYRDTLSKCVDCHKKQEPHRGRLGEKCADCHDQENWGKYRYDHNKTKYPLKGLHQKVACISCHPNQRWQKTPVDCYSCHKLNDSHGGRYGKKCESCHTMEESKKDNSALPRKTGPKTNWQQIIYDHDKTKFPLKDKHIKVACDKCHPGKLYEEKLELACYSCHKNDDEHKGRYDKKCETCHNQTGWKKPKYDHDKTKFPLKDKHIKVACEKCHTGPISEQKLGLTCEGCHYLDDSHKGRYGKKCESCHTPIEWKKHHYDHNKTKFPLKERHVKVACDKCHPGVIAEEKLGLTCDSCHLKDDIHKGQEGKNCERCHNQRGWGVDVFFDHDLTRFPLLGLHAMAPCEECHLGGAYKDTSMDCMSCHKINDVHKLRLGPKCGHCHNPNGWSLWKFDHNSQTKFVLDGAHEGLDCHACHKNPVEKEFRQPKTCYVCHKGEDVHLGRFGRPCERCHITKSFKEIRILP